ncbi:MAG: hypothetical protein HKN36_06765 [Hellea sp.]|nr:hypothetical protein [Hyphomonadaceae bacterium]NNE57794.1 hypothetical protein [Hellea sp.]
MAMASARDRLEKSDKDLALLGETALALGQGKLVVEQPCNRPKPKIKNSGRNPMTADRKEQARQSFECKSFMAIV